MRMIDIVKQAGMQAYEASNPVAVMFGTVTKTNPLEVNVDQRFTLTEDFLVVTERVTEYVQNLQHTHDYTDAVGSITLDKTTAPAQPAGPQNLVIRTGLQAGDSVLLLRIQGGQKYVILDKVVG
jgi:hypothetical protein